MDVGRWEWLEGEFWRKPSWRLHARHFYFIKIAWHNIFQEPKRASRVDWIPGRRRISIHLPFRIRTNTIIKYNLIAVKVLTELILARKNGH
jgi:hypothetical protein